MEINDSISKIDSLAEEIGEKSVQNRDSLIETLNDLTIYGGKLKFNFGEFPIDQRLQNFGYLKFDSGLNIFTTHVERTIELFTTPENSNMQFSRYKLGVVGEDAPKGLFLSGAENLPNEYQEALHNIKLPDEIEVLEFKDDQKDKTYMLYMEGIGTQESPYEIRLNVGANAFNGLDLLLSYTVPAVIAVRENRKVYSHVNGLILGFVPNGNHCDLTVTIDISKVPTYAELERIIQNPEAMLPASQIYYYMEIKNNSDRIPISQGEYYLTKYLQPSLNMVSHHLLTVKELLSKPDFKQISKTLENSRESKSTAWEKLNSLIKRNFFGGEL